MPLPRRLLILILWCSAVFELLIAVVVWLRPGIEAEQFHIAIGPDTLSLAYLLAVFLVFLTVICGLAGWHLRQGNAAGRHLAVACGLFWTGCGIELFLRYYEPRFLALDTARGLLLLALVWADRPALSPAAADSGARARLQP